MHAASGVLRGGRASPGVTPRREPGRAAPLRCGGESRPGLLTALAGGRASVAVTAARSWALAGVLRFRPVVQFLLERVEEVGCGLGAK